MRIQTRILCTVLASILLFASGQAFAASSPDGGVDALLELLSIKGVITPEEGAGLREKSGSSSVSGFKDVIELLRIKGAISNDEAETLLKKGVAKSKRNEPTKDSEGVEAEANGAEAAVEANAKLPEDEIRPVLLLLREQGVLGGDEAEQIKERIGKEWSSTDEDDFIAMDNQEIEYNRSTLPKESLLANITKLRHQALITDEEAERIRKRFMHKLSLERVTDTIGENIQRDMRAEVADKILPIPEWTKRIKISGDLRLRFRADLFDKNNGPFIKPDQDSIFPLGNSTVDRYYTQVRARLGLTARITDELEGGLGLATGNTTNPVSTNSTLGDSLNKKNFLLDLAYLKWSPHPTFTLWGGRFENPWFSTDLIWDQDVNFDGLAMSWKPAISSDLNLFFTAGAFPIEEVEMSSHDKWLYGGQIGVTYKMEDKLTATLAAAYYHFDNITGVLNNPADPAGATNFTKPKFQQKGNTVFFLDPTRNSPTELDGPKGYAAEFNELNISAKIDFAINDPYHMVLIGDYVNNIGYNKSEVDARVGAGIKKETEGFQVGVSVGHPDTRTAWNWRLLLNYKYLEADAVLDAFTDSDFHLGGTNARGWITGADLGVAKNVWFTTRWLTADSITGVPFAVDVFQLNLNAKF